MTESPSPAPPLSRWWALIPSILLPLLAIRHLGQDANWDLQNYHLYDPYAWLHDRLTLDIAPAQLQTWHNPALDVPFYLMVSAGWHGALIALWLALPMMLALYFLLRMYPLMSADQATRSGSLALALMAATGAAALPAMGSSFNDGYVAAGVLGGLYLLLRDDSGGMRWQIGLLTGMAAGATAGLKLTAAVYCVGLAGAVAGTLAWRRLPRQLGALLLGGVIGFLLTYGYWADVLYRLHGNPFFPYFNQIFHSPDALPLAHTDLRFRPASLVEVLLVPLRLLRTNRLYSELLLRDPRLLLGVLGSVALYLSTFRRGVDTAARLIWRRRVIAGFFFVSLLVWAGQYGIYRYVLPLEMLACMTAVVAAQWLPLPRGWRNLLLIVASLVVARVTVHPQWGRVDFTQPMLQVRMPALSPDSLVVISSESPLAFAVTALPDEVPVISIANNFMRPDRCTNLQADAERRIAGHTGPLWLLRSDATSDDDGERVAGQYYGLFASAPCQPVVTSLGKLRLCPMQRRPVPAICATATATTNR